MTYHAGTPTTDHPARCYPERKIAACYVCSRHRLGYPTPPEQRPVEVIDASLMIKDGKCPLFIERRAAKPYAEVDA